MSRPLAVVLAMALTTGAFVLAAPAMAKHPRPPYQYGPAIEELAGYEPQTTCRKGARPGVAAYADLLERTYPRTSSLGIARACDVGGTSEHKEGRAFDWGVSAYDAVDRKRVRDLVRWLRATDRHGNSFAIARRLGIQYLIWNRRIWRAYDAESGWQVYTGSNPHTDHVHFSFSWRGARKNTSFWTGPKQAGPDASVERH